MSGLKLQTKNLSKSYDGRLIIDDINIKLNKNEIVSVIGISGSGKTTLFNLLSGLEQETLSLYLSGLSYEEIAAQLNLSTKAVDNALQRVRRKLREV